MKDGIHNISIDEYHGNKTHVSSTRMKLGKKSIAHFFYEFEERTKSCFDFGNAFELALVDPEQFQSTVAIMPIEDWERQVLELRPEVKGIRSTTEYKEFARQFLEENEGKYIITDTGKESFELVEKMLTPCYKDMMIKAYCVGGIYQNSYFWTCPHTGLKMKSRPDVERKTKKGKNVLVDIKTGLDFSPFEFNKRYLPKYDLPMQAVMQIEGFEACTGENVDEYYWLGVEKNEPHLAQLYRFAPEQIEWIKEDFLTLKERIARAQKEKKIVGYGDRGNNPYGILDADIPPYYSTYIVE